MRYKPGVLWMDMHPSVDGPDFSKRLDKVFQKFGVAEAVITSGRDGIHKTDSFHYKGKAFDLRTWHVLEALNEALREELGPHYDVLLEKDHIHIELSPLGLKNAL